MSAVAHFALVRSMAQWVQGYSGHTHDTKVLALEDSLRQAVSAHTAALEEDRGRKAKAVHLLAERLLAARRKALRARIARLGEPDMRDAPKELEHLQNRERKFENQGVEGILREFGFHAAHQI